LVSVGLLLFHAFPSRGWRRLVLLGLNIIFISSFADALPELLPLVGFLLLSYLCIRFAQAQPSRLLFAGCIIILMGAFIYVKQYSIIEGYTFLREPYVTIGLSYIFFRVLQVLVDTYQGAITERPSPLRLFNHICFFLTFISGPIQRFQDYRGQEDALSSVSITSEKAYEAFSRIINGSIKLVFFSAVFQDIHEYSLIWMRLNPDSRFLWIGYACACFAYLLQMYINFSGYMDVVIGVGGLFGFSLPENFNYPLSSSSFLDVWRRWHITLGDWFKLYLFTPTVKALTRRGSKRSHVPYYGVLAFFVTFFATGLWHETTTEMILLGFLLGFGVSFNKLYEVEMRKRLGKKRFGMLRENFFYSSFMQGLTITYLAISLTSLWWDIHTIRSAVERLGLAGGALSLALCVFGVVGVKLIYELLWKCSSPLASASKDFLQTFVFQQTSLALRLFLLTFLLFDAHGAIPEIAYMGF
jgi:D-alanyl-lipoteichoic acid acyltransferase DltB (MBOAT superfamily)